MAKEKALDLITKQRAQLDKESDADIQRLVDSYGLMSERLKDKVDLLLLEMERNPDANVVTMERYKELARALLEEFERYDSYLEVELQRIKAQAERQGRVDSAALIAALLLGYGLNVRPGTIPTPSILPDILAPGSPHALRLAELAPAQAQWIINKLLEGIQKGYGFQKLGRMIVDALGLGLADALRWARTIQMEAYREMTHRTMLENSGIIDGWTWFAQVDERTCEHCGESHGSYHPVSETLNDLTTHIWNCRCVELPHVIGSKNPITGEPIGE